MNLTTITPNDNSTRRTAPWSIVIGVLLLRTTLLFAANAVFTLLTGSYTQALMWSSVTIVAVDVFSIAVVAHLARRHGRTLRSMIGARLRDTGWAVLVIVIVLTGFLVATFIGNLVAFQGAPPMPTQTFTPPLWLAVWSITIMPVTIALAEELLYRGWAQSELTRRTNRALGVLIMAVFFGLQHTALTPLDAQAQLARFITTFLAGVLFGALYLWRQRLWPLIVAHWFLDVAGLGLPMLAAALA